MAAWRPLPLVLLLLLLVAQAFAQVGFASKEGHGKKLLNRPADMGETPEEEAEVSSDVGISVAATLLGAICFQMSLFYLTNHPDEDMRKYTYEVMSSTISIFCAVLLFQGFNGVVESWVPPGVSEHSEVAIDMIHMLFWYIMLQVVLAILSGALSEILGQPAASMDTIEANLRCFAVLLAHLTGFASINAWASLQQLPVFATPGMKCLCILMSICVQLTLQKISDCVRDKISLADDGEFDEYEEHWIEHAKDAENDVMGLTVSWQVVQVARFLISGCLPSPEGHEPWDELRSHGDWQILYLLLFAAILALIVCLAIIRREWVEAKAVALCGSAAHRVLRVYEVVVTSTSMGFAWSTFVCVKWWLAWLQLCPDEMMLAVCVAVVVSLFSVCGIRVLDLLADAEWTNADHDAAIGQLIAGISILVGFSWEQCFDEATDAVAAVSPKNEREEVKLALALFCAVILVPAWRWWILPMSIKEGWRFGFVIDQDNHDQWLQLFKHKSFQELVDKMHDTHFKRQATRSMKASTKKLESRKSLLGSLTSNDLGITSALQKRGANPAAARVVQRCIAMAEGGAVSQSSVGSFTRSSTDCMSRPLLEGSNELRELRERVKELEMANKQLEAKLCSLSERN